MEGESATEFFKLYFYCQNKPYEDSLLELTLHQLLMKGQKAAAYKSYKKIPTQIRIKSD